MSLEQTCFAIVLHILHNILDFFVFVWLQVNTLRRKLIFRDHHIKEDFYYLEKNSQNILNKVPRHIALAFLESTISLEDVAKLVIWSIASGSTCISLYDYHGYLKTHKNKLIERLDELSKFLPHNLFKIKWHHDENNHNNVGGEGGTPAKPHHNGGSIIRNEIEFIHVCLLSKLDGQADIVKAAQKLAHNVADGTLIVENVNEALLTSALTTNRGLPDPELLLRFGMAHSNVGFPPWQIRLSEIHDIDTHKAVARYEFFHVLLKFSKCEQRFGC